MITIIKPMEELPIVGNTYNCYDDGKIRSTRQYHIKITKIIPYSEASDEDKQFFEINSADHPWLFGASTDYLIYGKADENKDYPNAILARDKDGYFFGLGAIKMDDDYGEYIDNFWNSGLLDVSGKLTEKMTNNEQ